MAKRREAKAKEPKRGLSNDPEDQKGRLKAIGGSDSDHWNNTLGSQTARTLWVKNSDEAARNRQLAATVAALAGIAPKDELEGMMAAQLIAAHNAAMECYRRAMIGEQTFEGRRENLNQARRKGKLRRWSARCDGLPKRLMDRGQRSVRLARFPSAASSAEFTDSVKMP